jgi:methionine aminopeptidase
LHEKPHVYNVLLPELKQQRFKAGMILAIEPITAEKSDEYIQKK